MAALLVGTLLAGLGIARMRRRGTARAAAWALVVASVAAAERLCAGQPAGFRMLALIGTLLYAMKAVVGVDGLDPGRPPLGPSRWLAFAALWPGMRPAPFARAFGPPLSGARDLVKRGLARLLLGLALVAAARLAWTRTGSHLLATALALPGLSFILHFGIFNLAAGAWRHAGVDVHALFRAPLLSRSLAEFWGRRWNLAFSEMTSAGIYRPVAALVGRSWGIAAAFLASGILHELAISVPARAGFGLPLIYFALQGTAVLVEGALEARETPVNGRGWIGRVWTLTWLALPLPILFHPPFLRAVVWPIAGM